jgi:hypothetical protein
MQYALVDWIYTAKLLFQKIKIYFKSGVKKNIDITDPNTGYGRLDIIGMFEQLK